MSSESRTAPAGSWALPGKVVATSGVLLGVILVPTALAGVVVGPEAALPIILAVIMCTGPASKLHPRYAVQLVAVVAVTVAVAVVLNGQPFAAACFAVLICLMIAPANTLDNGLLAAVPAMAAVYLASPSLTLEPEPTALWTLVGGVLIVALMATVSTPAPMAGISAATAYRHAVVMSVALGVSVYVVLHFDIPHGYWVPMTMALVLQPFAGQTRTKARQRIWGTVVGGVLALLLAFTLPPWAMVVAIVPLTLLNTAYSLLGRYGQAVVFLTPGAVLLANLASRDAQVSATIQRLLATLVGGLIAAVLGLLLERADQDETEPAEAPAQSA